MYSPRQNCFRNDLEIYQIGHNSDRRYIVKDPSTNATFELGEQELCLCLYMDGQLSIAEIISKFIARFQQSLSEQDVLNFSQSIAAWGLFSDYGSPPDASAANKVTVDWLLDLKLPEGSVNEPTSNPKSPKLRQNSKRQTRRLPLLNPQPLLNITGGLFADLAPLRFILILGLGLMGFLAFFCVKNNWSTLLYDLARTNQVLAFPLNIILSLLAINLIGNLCQGSAIARYGAAVNELGIKLAFGFFPLFYINKNGVKSFGRHQKLWVYGIPISFRLLLFSLSILLWQLSIGTQTQLRVLSLIFAQAALVGALLDINPLWTSNGYHYLSQLFRVPDLSSRAKSVLRLKFKNKALLKHLGTRKTLALLTYGFLSIASGIVLAIIFLSYAAITLESHLQGLGVVLFVGLATLILQWSLGRIIPAVYEHKSNVAMNVTEDALTVNDSVVRNKGRRITRGQTIGAIVILGLLGASIIPYQYRVGGQLTLLPPQQAEIQASTSGKFSGIFVEGGDGQLIEAGTVIATIQPSKEMNLGTPVEEDVPLIEQQILSQESVLERREAELDELLATPRPEEVTVAQSAVSVAEQEFNLAQQNLETVRQELNAAKQELETVAIRNEFREQEATRLRNLFNQGAVSRQQYEDAERLAAVSRSEVAESTVKVAMASNNIKSQSQNIEVARKNIEAAQAQLNLVLSGPHPEVINAARKDIQVAAAQLQEQQQKLANLETNLEDSIMVMPFDGFLTTAALDQKAGTFIEQGDLFAIAENDQLMLGELQVPEFEIDEFEIGSPVQTRLLAFPDEVISGRVVSMEPAVTDTPDGRFVKVTVEFSNTSSRLTSGMTGYAKIEGTTMPAIVAFTRPLVRFFRVEVWSWFP